ncbi:MAG TPA: hypothetical protein VNZ02_06970 [Steroidobacteraceae bacterium]|jgi:hypothetical protein|nr:hypothetical protein [Steroidobacteraceae bacterium]
MAQVFWTPADHPHRAQALPTLAEILLQSGKNPALPQRTQFSEISRDAWLRSAKMHAKSTPKTEHILLESEPEQVPELRDARISHTRFEFRSRLRRRVTQLEIIDYYYLSVRSRSRTGLLDYVLDLRFVDAPRNLRHIPWAWIAFSLLFVTLAVGIVSRIDLSAIAWWRHNWLAISSSALGVWAFATLVAVYRTTEKVSLFSSHGAARLLECTGGLGTFRAFRGFTPKLAAHIQLAAAARRPTKSEHLRDEMREHLRLKDIGAISAGEYEKAKLRVLGQHSPPRKGKARTRQRLNVGA